MLSSKIFSSCPYTASNVSASLNQKSWTLYKMYWRLANGILMGTLRPESRGVYDCGGSNKIQDTRYKMILLSFHVYNYTHIRHV